MNKAHSKPAVVSSAEMEAVLRAVAVLPEERIDTSDPDAPEVLDWSGAVRGKFYRPVKALKSLRLDADVLAWFQAQGPGYQTRINQVLRESMLLGLRERQAGIEGAPVGRPRREDGHLAPHPNPPHKGEGEK